MPSASRTRTSTSSRRPVCETRRSQARPSYRSTRKARSCSTPPATRPPPWAPSGSSSRRRLYARPRRGGQLPPRRSGPQRAAVRVGRARGRGLRAVSNPAAPGLAPRARCLRRSRGRSRHRRLRRGRAVRGRRQHAVRPGSLRDRRRLRNRPPSRRAGGRAGRGERARGAPLPCRRLPHAGPRAARGLQPAVEPREGGRPVRVSAGQPRRSLDGGAGDVGADRADADRRGRGRAGDPRLPCASGRGGSRRGRPPERAASRVGAARPVYAGRRRLRFRDGGIPRLGILFPAGRLGGAVPRGVDAQPRARPGAPPAGRGRAAAGHVARAVVSVRLVAAGARVRAVPRARSGGGGDPSRVGAAGAGRDAG